MTKWNGTSLTDVERKNCEVYYMKTSFKNFLVSLGEEDYKVETLEDERLAAYMFKEHPRFY